MIGGLQGEFGDLDIKYLKQNISKCRSHIRDLDIKYLKQNISKYLNGRSHISGSFRRILKKNISKCRSHMSGSFRRTPWHCAKWLLSHPGRRLSDDPITSVRKSWNAFSPIGRHASDAKYPDGMCRMQDIRVESGGSRMEWRSSKV